jgi:hypothetical protein
MVPGQESQSQPPECAVCGLPVHLGKPFGGWLHDDLVTVHGHVAQGSKRMTIAEFKAQREARNG